MNKIYLANGTHQHIRFNYRVPERQTARVIDVPAGKQVCLNVINDIEGKSIIEQLIIAGAVLKSEIRLLRPRTLVYSVDSKPIVESKLDEARELDQVARQEVSAEKTREAGLALLAVAQAKSNSDAVSATSLSVKQVSETGGINADGRASVKEAQGGVNVEIQVRKDAPGKLRTEKIS